MVCGDVEVVVHHHANTMCCIFFAYSVASAMTSETPERYERLTSVSSSVDIDQRDTVSVPVFVQDNKYVFFGLNCMLHVITGTTSSVLCSVLF